MPKRIPPYEAPAFHLTKLMHLLFRESLSLDEATPAIDLGQSAAPLLFLSFADSDLAALASAWDRSVGLRLASLGRLRHPLSVDLYVESVVSRARCVVLRLLGGLEYWRYGLEEVSAVCGARAIRLVVLAGDGAGDALAKFGTVTPTISARMDALLREGGSENAGRALRLAGHLADLGPDPGEAAVPMPICGEHLPAARDGYGLAVIVFYRAHLLAGDIAPILAMADALASRGLAVRAVHVASLKQPECAAFVTASLQAWRPRVVLNATAFSARVGDASPLEAGGCVVLQVILSGSGEAGWRQAARGLSPADLAMQVVLPEADGRLSTTAISFKAEQEVVDGLEFAATRHVSHPEGIALAADRAAGWARLTATPAGERRLAIVLSNYAGGQEGYAVGLDSFASLHVMLRLLLEAGYDAGGPVVWSRVELPLDQYRVLLPTLPPVLHESVAQAWGPPVTAPAFQVGRCGKVIVAIQPERGHRQDRRAGYHDPDCPPGHDYVGFHLWLRAEQIQALVQLGTHGTLEWLPGKAVALSSGCAPAALLGGLPVIYPFIVNNPGEAAVARRRLGAVTIGHLTPPLVEAGLHGEAAALEILLDEYAAADGMDRRRLGLLRRDILERAGSAGLLDESRAAGLPEDEALARLDAHLCDVKALGIRDGLHVFAQPPAHPEKLLASLAQGCPGADPERLQASIAACAEAERSALLAALDGMFVQPGPAGTPSRGRADVLPTGRNLSTIDARTVPTPTAMRLAEAAAVELLRRHRQEEGDWPRSLVLDLWGSATLRTGGEDFSLALVLLGVRPVWDGGSGRVNGIEILPLALLDRPRVDVTLRISGLFRDAFADQVALFDQAVRALAQRDEASDWNPLAGTDQARVFGPAPGCYGTGVEQVASRAEMAETYLANASFVYASGQEGVADRDGFVARIAASDAFVHLQDHRETDILDGTDHAAHEAGFAAAAESLGRDVPLYHADISDPEAPRARTVAEEVARVVRGRAANPKWIGGMQRHGRSGAAEISRPVQALYRFALGMTERFDPQFELLYDATLGNDDVDGFLRTENPTAHAAMADCFALARAQGLWHPRRNFLPTP